MDTVGTLKRLFDYDAWANRETLASLRAAGKPPARAVALLAHVAGAQQTWLVRLRGEAAAAATWPELGLDDLAVRLEELAAGWRAYVSGLRDGDLTRPFSYTNTKGEAFTGLVADAILQVLLHGSYHRGQVAVLLRTAGEQPTPTDYIRAVRTGAIG
jgi:uncharacterized damage-inducible protein DinB